MAAAFKAVGSSAGVSCSRQSSTRPVAVSRGQLQVVRVAQPQMFDQAVPAAADVAEPLPPSATQREWKALTPEDLVSQPLDPEATKLPPGYHWYETMIVLKAMLDDQSRDEQMAKFEAYLNKEGCLHINCITRPRSRMAYPMKKNNWDGMYVLFTYAAKRQTARSVQLLLSNPEAGSEDKILRHITFCRL